MSKSKKILFQMSGSIACYKACQVVSRLVQAGYEVQVVATSSALQFVGNATLEGLTGKPVVSELFESGNVMDHIHLVRWADLILTAPATANFINKAAHGVGDDLLTTQFLAHDFKKPYLIAPAMNTMMYLHPATQASIKRLREMKVEILETASGVLACGEVGWGRLLEPDLIVQEVELFLGVAGNQSEDIKKPVVKKSSKVLVTSGGTQEPIDPVRVLTNKSTGTTGALIADTLINFGFDVTYLHAENAKLPSLECEKAPFTSFSSLEKGLHDLLGSKRYQAVVHLAAVSDFSPVETSAQKMASDGDLTLHFKRNPKLIDQLRALAGNPDLKVVAFKLTAGVDKTAQKKAVTKLFEHSGADLVVQNDMSEMKPQHVFHIFNRLDPVADLRGKQELAFYLGEYLMKELL
jgi:phosphopantothenoylcysteine decarboxylase / phosphopantothenate---cysteine ligase